MPADAHYVSMGRWCTIIGIFVSIGTAYLVMQFSSIMDYVQALFSFFIAPLVRHGHPGYALEAGDCGGGLLGLGGGNSLVDRHVALVKFYSSPGALAYVALSPHAKDMAENMYRGLWSWIICVVVTVAVSLVTKPKTDTGAGRPRLRLYADPFRAARPPLATADLLGGRRRGRVHRAERDLLVRID